MKPLTPTQTLYLNAIKDLTKEFGYSPSFEEIGKRVRPNGININSVANNVHALEKKGYIIRKERRPRSIQIVKNEQ